MSYNHLANHREIWTIRAECSHCLLGATLWPRLSHPTTRKTGA